MNLLKAQLPFEQSLKKRARVFAMHVDPTKFNFVSLERYKKDLIPTDST